MLEWKPRLVILMVIASMVAISVAMNHSWALNHSW